MTDKIKPKEGRAQSRRNFLRGSATAAGAAIAGAAIAENDPHIMEVKDWRKYLGDGVDAAPYGQPIQFESHVVRRNVPWLTADNIASVNFTPLHELDGAITPNGLCFERHHGGAVEIDPAQHRLMINGLVEKEMVFTMEDLLRFPRTNGIYFQECAANSGMEWHGSQMNSCQFASGMIHNVEYTGVKCSTLFDAIGVKPEGTWVLGEGGDASGLTRSIPMEKIMDDCMIAWKMNGEALRKEQGYPLRLIIPGWEGNMWVKWLRRLEVGDKAWYKHEETSKYTDLMPDGRAREFTWVMDAKSVITSPSPEKPITHGKGPLVISGMAWSGRGALKKVDVSVDGGVTWNEARIVSTNTPKAMQRFYLDIDWKGEELFLQSRVTDETGYVQPTRAALREIRGTNSIYHNNGIITWHVNTDGSVNNVEIG